MKKQIIIASIATGLLLTGAIAFAETAGTNMMNRTEGNNPQMKMSMNATEIQAKIDMLMKQLQMINSGTTETSVTASADVTAKIACVGAAVNARETAIVSAETAFTLSANNGYSARATALQSAYTQTTADAVKTAVKKAWSDFTSSMKAGRTTWQAARLASWKTFRTAVAACKAPASVVDSANAETETSGL